MWPSPIRRAVRRLHALNLVRPSYVVLGRYAAVVTRDGHRLHLVAEDLSLTPTLALTGHWEPAVGGLLRRLLRPGDRVVEGGANVGAHTIPMAERIGPRGRLDAFEPLPDFHPLLERSLGANRVAGQVVLHQAALLDRNGPIEFMLDPLMLGSGHLAMRHVSNRYSRRVATRATTLDAALAEDGGRPVDLIRLDVEGSEMLALRGAEGVIRRSPRLSIVMEWSPEMLRARCDPATEAAWLASLGFRFWRLLGRRWSAPWRDHALVPVAAEALADLPHGEVLARREAP